MPRTVYIGKTVAHCGKRAFEILANLKNFGIGRVLQRNMFKAEFSEPCFYKVVQVDPQMDEELTWGRVWVEEVYRGRKYPYITEIRPWHPDYSLVPKGEEPDFTKFPVLGQDKSNIKILPHSFKVPPLMAEFLNRKKLGFYPNLQFKGLDMAKHGYDSKSLTEYTIPYSFYEQESDEFDFYYKIADPSKGEKPTENYEELFIKKQELFQAVQPNELASKISSGSEVK